MAYTTVGAVRSLLGIEESKDDVLLQIMIDAAEAIVDRETLTTFTATANVSRTFDAVANVEGRELWLDKYLYSINSITNGDETVLTSAQYTTIKNDAPYDRIKLLGSSGLAWTYTTDPEDAITVSGMWAWSLTAPADISYATMRLAAFLYRLKDSAGEGDRPIAIGDGVIVHPAQIPADVMMILNNYKLGRYF